MTLFDMAELKYRKGSEVPSLLLATALRFIPPGGSSGLAATLDFLNNDRTVLLARRPHVDGLKCRCFT